MRNFWKNAALIILLFAVCCSCGGGKGDAEALLSGSQATVISGSENVEFSIDRAASQSAFGVKRKVTFTYSLDGYPENSGFTVVPMADEFNPKKPGLGSFDCAVELKDGIGAVVRLSASGHKGILTHLRFDPKVWQVGSVISKNPWPTKDFLALPVDYGDGNLGIKSMPVGGDGKVEATGEFAVVTFQHTSAKGSSEAPDGEVDGHAGEGEATTKRKTGTTVSKLKPLSMPDSWPTAFPQYADSTITASQSSTEKGIAKMKVTLSTNDPVGRVEKFYSEKAKTAGYKTGTSRDMGPARIRHYVSDEFIVDVNIIQNSRTVVINISVRTTRGS